MEHSIKIAGGKITCRRCTALSKRTKTQCGRPALKTSNTQKCQFHGGKSTGPKTIEGKTLIANTHLIHGNETKAKRAERSRKMLWFAHMEDIMYVLGMTKMPRNRGRKPDGYKSIETFEEAKNFIKLDQINLDKGVLDASK